MKIITTQLPRSYEPYFKKVPLPMQYIPETGDFEWLRSFRVLESNADEAQELALQLFDYMLGTHGATIGSPTAERILCRLDELNLKKPADKMSSENWDLVARAMPADIVGNHQGGISRVFSDTLSGNVLEAFCGFASYLLPSVDRNVTALDYSEIMLKKYEYPERMRVQFDLNLVPGIRSGFPDGSFDGITFVKGYKYAKSPEHLFAEFYRLLKPGGSLMFVESTTAGYPDLILRRLDPRICCREVVQGGFGHCSPMVLPYRDSIKEEVVLFSAVKE